MHCYFVTFHLIDPTAKEGAVPCIKTRVVELDNPLEYESDLRALEADLEMAGMCALLLSWQELKGRERDSR
ncbi:hypothetical protein C6380_25030 [Pseudomonas syringae pv. actinidiae]|uniref:hypothetical protein n=1 Tax=Pseudomonas syringae TaxID=317 RepID=UPI000BB52CF4|nr:hypothetical protein [Pseudomonas syringae]PBK48069.1 hypothetical protein BUE61_27125 [Pseudomonas syringae pv. actinidiae]PBK49799.1 hypothetical protein BUE60_23465 [Pseudomonas syringae pv. actinidiae]RJX49767.1 hypothetical protein C6380_25030 [Pseudomonas syringae pv. actinidiae]RJX50207.1 hypothetical protein C6379_22910 [Pseudomonas syringae pv. actinidiae]RJX53975.1 hypothetical protein C6383_27145 [Pseudomonas syringae pv. actinidiae]